MIICKKCGTQNTGGDQFCGNCGAFLEWEGEVIAQDPGTTPAVPAEPPRPVPDPYATTVSPPGPVATTTQVVPTPAGPGPICGTCGLQNDPGLTFCKRCGAELAAGIVSTEPARPTPDDGSGGSRVPIVPILIGGFAIGVVLIGLVLFLGGGGTPGPSASPSGGIAIGSSSPLPSVEPTAATAEPSEDLTSAEPSASASVEPSASAEPTIEPTAEPVPDLIAFESNLGSSGGAERFDVFVANPDGSDVRQVTSGATANNYPSWSPDHSKIAYYTNVTNPSSIFITTVDGSSTIPLFASDSSQAGKNDTTPAWSPDGGRIAFVRMFHGIRQIYTATVDPATGAAIGNPKKLTTDDFEQLRPAWSPDGKLIVYRGPGADLFVIPAAGGKPTKLTTSGGGTDREPAWSPSTTSRQIAYARTTGAGQSDLFVVDVDANGKAKGAPRKLTSADGEERYPAWSPDGKSILYWADGGKGGINDRHLFKITSAGKNCVPIIEDPDHGYFDPAWN